MDYHEDSARGAWGSKLAFIFAAAGSAIGLGNIWRYPMMVGLNGGAIFVFVNILAVIFIGFTIMLAEFAIGRHTRKNPVGAFNAIKPGTPWKLVGYLNVAVGIGILSFYGVIAGWAVGYFFKAIAGAFSRDLSWKSSDAIFKNFSADPLVVFVCFFVIIALTVFIISKGIKGGIEKWSKILMPILFVLIIFLAIRALTLPGAGRGLAFYLKPDFSKFNFTVLFFAVAQAFFSLSIGNGSNDDLCQLSFKKRQPRLFDTLVAFLAGIIIFSTLFASPGIVPGEFKADTGLMFQVFPMVLSKMPGGYVFGVMFFTLLLVAVLTSTLSLLEVPTAFLVDEKKWTRMKAATFLGALAFIVGIPSALSNGGVKLFTKWGVMIKMDFIFISLGLTVGALFISVFLGYAWGVKNALKEISFGNSRFKLKFLWIFNVKYLAPVVIVIILIVITNIF
ncbi:hypothetical protein ES703_46971 [subsurface metagenome]